MRVVTSGLPCNIHGQAYVKSGPSPHATRMPESSRSNVKQRIRGRGSLIFINIKRNSFKVIQGFPVNIILNNLPYET